MLQLLDNAYIFIFSNVIYTLYIHFIYLYIILYIILYIHYIYIYIYVGFVILFLGFGFKSLFLKIAMFWISIPTGNFVISILGMSLL